MHLEKAWIAGILLVAIVVGSNLIMYALVRGWAPRKGGKNLLQDFSQPWKMQDSKFKELNERVKALDADHKNEQT